MAINPFKRSGGNAGASTPPRKPHGQEPSEGEARDPLDVEDLLVDGSKRASINADGTMTSKSDALKGHQEHIDLVKQREWGAEIQRVKKEQELMSKKFPHFKMNFTKLG